MPQKVAANLTDPDGILDDDYVDIELRGDEGVPYDVVNSTPLEGVRVKDQFYIFESFRDTVAIYRAILVHVVG